MNDYALNPEVAHIIRRDFTLVAGLAGDRWQIGWVEQTTCARAHTCLILDLSGISCAEEAHRSDSTYIHVRAEGAYPEVWRCVVYLNRCAGLLVHVDTVVVVHRETRQCERGRSVQAPTDGGVERTPLVLRDIEDWG